MSQKTKPRLAVVSSSHVHHKFYRETIARDAIVVAYSDPDQAKIEEVREFYGDTGHLDWRDLLDPELRLDGVVNLAPHDEMKDVSLAFIERGIPIILEKPGGINAAEVEEIRKASDKAQVPIAVAFIQRAGHLWSNLQKIGNLDYATFLFQSGPPERYILQSPWLLEKKRAGGGCFINLAVHYIDLFLKATGATSLRVQAQSQRRLSPLYDVEDRMSALITTPEGVSAVIEVGYIFPASPDVRYLSYSARGDNGFLAIDRSGDIALTKSGAKAEVSNNNVDSGPLTTIFIEAAVAGVLNGFSGLAGIADLHQTIQVVDAAYKSAATGEAVTLDII
ncbi:Gfo/Idh/MocA family protein [Serratia sp. M24T3]|uniref:Gfo/Idh/MocA family protein n=1 Tax=Serratia sp. M24T3 TaxID=932213 RepID=UPI00025BB681|nr:Gfo/Idh/MocA family oxidoreductase [Serratia sp. M24T3]EIC83094.1 oxidoreductase [Serratia sp. M24T3]